MLAYKIYKGVTDFRERYTSALQKYDDVEVFVKNFDTINKKFFTLDEYIDNDVIDISQGKFSLVERGKIQENFNIYGNDLVVGFRKNTSISYVDNRWDWSMPNGD